MGGSTGNYVGRVGQALAKEAEVGDALLIVVGIPALEGAGEDLAERPGHEVGAGGRGQRHIGLLLSAVDRFGGLDPVFEE